MRASTLIALSLIFAGGCSSSAPSSPSGGTRAVTGTLSARTYQLSNPVVIAESSDNRVFVTHLSAGGHFTLQLPTNVSYRLTLANSTRTDHVYTAVARINWPLSDGPGRWATVGDGATLDLGTVHRRGDATGTGGFKIQSYGDDHDDSCKEDDGEKCSHDHEDDCDCDHHYGDDDHCDKDGDGDQHDHDCDHDHGYGNDADGGCGGYYCGGDHDGDGDGDHDGDHDGDNGGYGGGNGGSCDGGASGGGYGCGGYGCGGSGGTPGGNGGNGGNGGTPGGAGNGSPCNVNGDCASGACIMSVCAPPSGQIP